MTYKEAIFFIGKCLTISHEKQNRSEIELELKKNKIDWDIIVKVSTAQYVFPALYCNLQSADFLQYLPIDLVEYMIHITDLNRERNQQIIKQAKEINELLLANNITPIFLKGTGNLLEGLYEDIAERMVGDIDLLIHNQNCESAYKLLQKNGYFNKNKISKISKYHRHLPRIIHVNKIGAVEIHKEMLRKEKSKFFNYDFIKNSLEKINGITFLSFENQIKLTVFSKFINDDAYLLKNISLRAAYDIFLLDKKLKKHTSINHNHLNKELNAGLKLYTSILSQPKNFSFISSKKENIYLNKYINSIDNTKQKSLTTKKVKSYLWFKSRFTILFKALFNKSYFTFVFSRLTDLNWYKKKIGFKTKPNS